MRRGWIDRVVGGAKHLVAFRRAWSVIGSLALAGCIMEEPPRPASRPTPVATHPPTPVPTPVPAPTYGPPPAPIGLPGCDAHIAKMWDCGSKGAEGGAAMRDSAVALAKNFREAAANPATRDAAESLCHASYESFKKTAAASCPGILE